MGIERPENRICYYKALRSLVIVPAYNEAAAIAATIADIRGGFPEAAVVVVNDGSRDGTAEAAQAAGAAVLHLPFNLGIGGSVQAGLKYAVRHGFEIAVQVDGDGQHPASEIPKLIAPILAGEADVVIGSRFLPGSDGYRSTRERRAGIFLLRLLNRLFIRQKISDATSGFRAYNRAAIALLAQSYPRDYPEPEAVVLLARRGFRLRETPVAMRERQGGRSSIRGWRAYYYMLKVMLSLTIEMLRKRNGG
jgi:glycosyltransferase involved in cell wall biosynthesis